jgi:Uma2 family endonuclease
MHTPMRFVPRLENGDHLTRDEFERRYEAMPNLKKTELIDGEVFMPSPVRVAGHANPHAALITWLGLYWSQTPIVAVADNGTIRLDLESEPQPDAALYLVPDHGGQVHISTDDYIEGGPELVAEVSGSSVSIDLHRKLQMYLRNNVREYVVWRVFDEAIDWFVARNGQYELLPRASGLYQSEVFPGLWLDPDAMVALNLARVIQVIQAGCATPQHAAFVATNTKR